MDENMLATADLFTTETEFVTTIISEDEYDEDDTQIIDTSASDIAYRKLLPALAKCFMVIFVGYISGKFGLMSDKEANGLGIFLRQFSLPSLIFLTLARTEFGTVNWAFVKCLVLAKAIVFFSLLIVTLLLTRPLDTGKAGLYSIFCTQSNDLCLGLPLVTSLYNEDHPEFANYLYILAPFQLVVLNPIGFFFMELQRQNKQNNGKIDNSFRKFLLTLVKCTLYNPVVVMTFLGVLGNVLFNHQLPLILDNFLDVLGAAFPATALFALGHSLVGKFSTLKGPSFITPSLLILTKILILPLLNRQLVHFHPEIGTPDEKKDYENFGFLYGTIPTAPTVYVFATQFELETKVVASGMVVATFLSAPLMFISASMTTLTDPTATHFRTDLGKAVTYSSIISAVCCIWVLTVFLVGKKRRNITHGTSFYLIVAQLIAAIGGIVWSLTEMHSGWKFYCQYLLTIGGIFAARIWTALLSVLLAILYGKGLCFVLRIKIYMIALGYSASVAVALLLASSIGSYTTAEEKIHPSFQFGRTQAVVAAGILVVCLLTSILSLIIQQWYHNYLQTREAVVSTDHSSDTDTAITNPLLGMNGSSLCPMMAGNQDLEVSDIEEFEMYEQSKAKNALCALPQNFPLFCDGTSGCSQVRRKKCGELIQKYKSAMQFENECGVLFERYEDGHQIMRHITLIILLCISMIIGLSICLWKLLLESKTGIYVELEFLDAVLSYGQGIFSFAVFGLDTHLVIDPCKRWWRRFRYGSEELVLPDAEELPIETRHICQQFITYHLEKCMKQIVSDRKLGKRKYKEVFSGKDLVDWLIDVGLASDRMEAEEYGSHLLLGKVIKHVKERYYFHDSPHLYRFIFRD